MPEPDHFAMGYAGDMFTTAWYLRKSLPGGVLVDYLTALGTETVSDNTSGVRL